MVVFLECGTETLLERILRRGRESDEKREDDNEETARNRIATFTRNAGEILESYTEKTKRVMNDLALCLPFMVFPALSYAQINGDRTIDEVFADISTELENLLASKFPATAAN